MKRLIPVILILILLFTATSYIASASQPIYAPDGRVAYVWSNEVAIYCNLGWYSYPVVTIYAPDGRSAVIAKSDLQAYRNVGWYDYPVTAMYSDDGRKIVVSSHAVSAYQKVGWYVYVPKSKEEIARLIGRFYDNYYGARSGDFCVADNEMMEIDIGYKTILRYRGEGARTANALVSFVKVNKYTGALFDYADYQDYKLVGRLW